MYQSCGVLAPQNNKKECAPQEYSFIQNDSYGCKVLNIAEHASHHQKKSL